MLGELALASSIWVIASVFLGFGTDTYIIKTVARAPEKAKQLIPATITIRSVLFLVSALLVWAYINFMGYSTTVATIAFFVGVSVIGGQISGSITAVLTGLERMELVSFANVATKIAYTGSCLLFLFMGLGVYWVAGASIISVIVGLLFLWRAVTRESLASYTVDFSDIPRIMSSSYQYLITSLMLAVYQNIDSMFIASLVDAKAVGYYGTAMGLYATMMFLPTVIGTIIFPILSRGFAEASSQINNIVRRTFNLMFVISVPIGFGIAVVGEPFVQLIYGPEFAPSGTILSMFGVVLIFTYLNTFFAQLLISVDRTKRLNITIFIIILATFPLDFALIPWFENTLHNGALGGAFSFLLTEFGQVAMALLLLPKGTLEWANVRSVTLTLCAGTVMIVATYWLREQFLPLSIIVGAVSYTAMILVLRVLPKEDFEIVQQTLERFQTKMRAAFNKGTAPSP